MKTNAQTTVNFIPRTGKVIIKADFKVSALNILNEEVINKEVPKSYTIVAIGSGVEEFEIGDKIKLSHHACMPQVMDFDWNNQSLKCKQDIHKNGSGILGINIINFTEYLIVDSIDIIGTWIDETKHN